ncbi:MAG TPA: winged helix-turn-helix transcriptional regulator [Gemmatimonadaceae bacterium]|nr:winged helix-turn-helix transcriptional regulator [Gemmatimonadaceae bacterium]
MRAEILIELKRARCSARELAERLSLSLNAVRHHLKELEADGLVEYEREQRGVGAPAHAYHLTLRGEHLFPRRYEETLLHLLDRVVEREGREAAIEMLETRYRELAARLRPELEGAAESERARIVTQALVDEGYMAEWRGSRGDGQLTEHNCAIHSVAERFPEVCAAEARFFEETLGATVERRAHILGGCTACEYVVRFARDASHPAAGDAPVGLAVRGARDGRTTPRDAHAGTRQIAPAGDRDGDDHSDYGAGDAQADGWQPSALTGETR